MGTKCTRVRAPQNIQNEFLKTSDADPATLTTEVLTGNVELEVINRIMQRGGSYAPRQVGSTEGSRQVCVYVGY